MLHKCDHPHSYQCLVFFANAPHLKTQLRTIQSNILYRINAMLLHFKAMQCVTLALKVSIKQGAFRVYIGQQ